MDNKLTPKNLKIVLIAVAAVFALVLVSAIAVGISKAGSSNEATPDYSVIKPEPEPVETMSIDDQYLFTLHYIDNYIIESTADSDLVALGKQVCSALDAGNSVQDLQWGLVSSADGSETDAYWEFAGAVIGAGVAAYCPEYNYQIG